MNVWLTTWQTRNHVDVGGWQMLAAAGISLPYVFVSRAMFPGQEKDPERSLEEHYLKHRILILAVMTAPPVVSVVSRLLLDGIHEYGWREAWMTVRVATPLVLMPFKSRSAQRVGLAAFAILEVIGLFR
jgi:uncharacterized membrane protein